MLQAAETGTELRVDETGAAQYEPRDNLALRPP